MNLRIEAQSGGRRSVLVKCDGCRQEVRADNSSMLFAPAFLGQLVPTGSFKLPGAYFCEPNGCASRAAASCRENAGTW